MQRTKSILMPFGSANKVVPEGVVRLRCKSKHGIVHNAQFAVVDINCQPLLGLDACSKLNLIKRVDNLKTGCSKEEIIEEYSDVFKGMGKMPFLHKIEIKEGAIPVVNSPRRVPLSLSERLKTTLDGLEKDEIIDRVSKPTEWVNNLVIVEKKNGTLRLCLDPQSLNKVIKREHYLIPKAEDIIARLSGKTVFSVLDMCQGFWHIPITDESADLCTFSTPFGRYRFKRLPYGICSAPEIFQKLNNQVFGDIPGVEVYFDDLIIAGATNEEHDLALKKVFERARENTVKFNKSKFQFRIPEVKYVGCRISAQGIRADETNVNAIVEMPVPKDKKALLRLLGMTKYLAQYIPNLSKVTAPLRELTKQNIHWHWDHAQDKSLKELKDLLIKAPVLGIFDSKKPLTLQTDASKDGLGACISQDGHPIAYASRSLTRAEQNYAQIEKEFLAICFGLERFNHFTYGRLVSVQSDHKPLETICTREIAQVSARLQRMKLRLLKYQCTVRYVPGKHLYLADTLSRAYVTSPGDGKNEEDMQFIVHSVSKYLPMANERRAQFVALTREDDTLSCLRDLIMNGWPNEKHKVPDSARFYWPMRDLITIADDLIFYGDKLIVPVKLRSDMLKIIHEGHSGIERCKARARECLFWPGIGQEIENYVANCRICEKYSHKNVKEPLLPHPVPDREWEKIGADILQYGAKDYLVVIDYYSKWIELCQIADKTASTVITNLKSIFARFGVPDVLVSDNMPFSSYEFRQFCEKWNFKLTTTSPIYPQSNGMSEKSVSIVKNILRKAGEEGQDPYIGLLEYRTTPIKGLNFSPSQLLFSRRLKTKLPMCTKLLEPEICSRSNVKDKLIKRQEKQKQYFDRGSRQLPTLERDENILIHKGKYWEPGVVVSKCAAPRSYIVQDSNGQEYRRNRRFLKKSNNEPVINNPLPDIELYGNTQQAGDDVSVASNDEIVENDNVTPPVVTRSGRRIIKPAKFNDYVM